jgi:hypothetical protein
MVDGHQAGLHPDTTVADDGSRIEWIEAPTISRGDIRRIRRTRIVRQSTGY